LYHLYLITLNQTTNESAKLSDLKYMLENKNKSFPQDSNPLNTSEKDTSAENTSSESSTARNRRKTKKQSPSEALQSPIDLLTSQSLKISEQFYNLGIYQNFRDALFRYQ
jgi:hypothetical protein